MNFIVYVTVSKGNGDSIVINVIVDLIEFSVLFMVYKIVFVYSMEVL